MNRKKQALKRRALKSCALLHSIRLGRIRELASSLKASTCSEGLREIALRTWRRFVSGRCFFFEAFNRLVHLDPLEISESERPPETRPDFTVISEEIKSIPNLLDYFL